MSNSTTPLVAIATKIKFKLSGKVVDQLRELNEKHVLAMNRLNEISQSDLRILAIEGQRRALAQLKKATNSDEVAAISEPTKNSLAVAAAEQRSGLKNALRAISAEAFELAGPEVRRFILAAQEHLMDLEAYQITLAESYGLTYSPSPLIERLRIDLGNLTEQNSRSTIGTIIRPLSLVETFAPIG
jgi:hypothetical protein